MQECGRADGEHRVIQHFPKGAPQNTTAEDIDRCFTCTCPWKQDSIINELGETKPSLTSFFIAGFLRAFITINLVYEIPQLIFFSWIIIWDTCSTEHMLGNAILTKLLL